MQDVLRAHPDNSMGYHGIGSFQVQPNAKRMLNSVTEGHQVIFHPPPEPVRLRVNNTFTSNVFSGPEATYKPTKTPVPNHPMDQFPVHHHPSDQLLHMNQRPPNFRRGKPDTFKDKVTESNAFAHLQYNYRPDSDTKNARRALRNPTNKSQVFVNGMHGPERKQPDIRITNTFDGHTEHFNFSDKSEVAPRIAHRNRRGAEECYADKVRFSDPTIPHQHPTNIRRHDDRRVLQKSEYTDVMNPSRVLDTTSPPPVYVPSRKGHMVQGKIQYADVRSIVFDKDEPPRRRQLQPGCHHVSEAHLNMSDEGHRLVTPMTKATYELHDDILSLAHLPQRKVRGHGEYVSTTSHHASVAAKRDEFYDRQMENHPNSPKHATAMRHLGQSPGMLRAASQPTLGLRDSPLRKSPGRYAERAR